jgi:uncharacterized protein
MRAVIDTNVFLGAILSGLGLNRQVNRRCLERRVTPLMGEELFRECVIDNDERKMLFEAFLSVSQRVRMYFNWRPKLPDEGDNHLIELAVAGGAGWIVSRNQRHFQKAELKFPGIKAITPNGFLEILR